MKILSLKEIYEPDYVKSNGLSRSDFLRCSAVTTDVM